MTYKNRFVAEIKLDGKILRLKNETVYLPFGSEYSLMLKNMNARRASVSISIDGQDVLDGNSLIIDPNETTELMGFLRGAITTNRFRFIPKTKKIQDHRGDKIEDGLVRIEFAFEKSKPEPWIAQTIQEVHNHYHNIPYVYYGDNSDWTVTYNSNSGGNLTGNPINNQTFNCNVENLAVTPNQDEGITVKGSQVDQRFNYASMGELEEPEVIVIKLCGIKGSGTKVSKPLTVKTKLTCSSCGTKSKSLFQFCPNCGTYLD